MFAPTVGEDVTEWTPRKDTPTMTALAAPQHHAYTATPTTGTVSQPTPHEPTFVRWADHYGKVFTQPVSVYDAITAAQLDFTVGKLPLTATTHLGEALEVPAKVATVRYNPDGSKQVLGVVGPNYTIAQNTDAFGWAQALLDDYDANILAASSYGQPLGSKAFIAARTRTTFTVQDIPHDVYVLLHNSHDGSTGLNVSVTAIRRDTGTEINVAPAGAAQRWTVRHSGDLEAKAREAADTMRQVNAWVNAFTGMTHAMLAKPMNAEQFTRFAKAFMPTPTGAKERSEQLWADRRLELADLYQRSEQCAFGRGTYLAAFNAACVWVDERYQARGDDSQKVRAARGIDGRATQTKQRAWDILAATM